MPFQEGLGVEGLGGFLHQQGALDRFLLLLRLEILDDGVGAEGHGLAVGLLVRPPAERQEALGLQVHDALETATRAGRPVERGGIQGELGGDLVQQGERILGLAVHLVDEGQDGDVAKAADLEQLERLRLDALGGVQHHHGRVRRGQGAVGVFREVLVARGVQQVHHQTIVLEGHHAGRDRDAALALDLHPVRAGAALLAARPHGAGQADGPRGVQQVFRQRGLAGVGVGDDGEGAPPGGLGGRGGRGHGGGR